MATIKEIARKAGVSATTVSNVLHGRMARVSQDTKEKVEAILDADKYAPNMGAMILASNNSRIIGVIMFMKPRRNETVLEDPFSSTILGAIEAEIRRYGYFLMLHTTSDENEVIRLSKTWKLDGLVLMWVPGSIGCVIRKSMETPLVFVDSYFEGASYPCFNVGLDDFSGGYAIATYVLSMGHRRVVFLANDKVYPGSDRTRFEGCRRAFEERGLSFNEEQYIILSKDAKERHKLYRRFIGSPPEFTALMFSADYYAVEAVSFLAAHGTRVPEDVSVTGFDDNIFSRLIRPQLTTVHQDVYQKGKKAVEMLMLLINGESVVDADVRLPVRLVVRDSVQAIAGADLG
ncbi:MAG: LacI family DNA-binding transcriptional regulator [Spirochaetales bacterium]|nr:LacI family DNA-binding transcriptional regulator [Spirochaetales bacterium]